MDKVVTLGIVRTQSNQDYHPQEAMLPSPGLEDSAKGPLADVPDVLNVVTWILQVQQLSIEQQW